MSHITRLLLVVLCLSARTLPAAAAPAAATFIVYAPLTMGRPLPNYRIAFMTPEGQLATIHADGSDILPLFDSPMLQWTLQPLAWSPDGTQLAFGVAVNNDITPSAASGVYTIHADGQHATHVAHHTGGADIAWSPDGHALVFTQFITTTNTYTALVVDADGHDLHAVSGSLVVDSPVHWSPDGSHLVFTAEGNLYLVHPDGTQLQQVTTTGDIRNPVWSRDGTELAYEQSGTTITRFTVASRQATVVTTGNQPSWSPDGTQLAYIAGRVVMVINRDGSHPRAVSHTTEIYQNWRSTPPQWSPDGTRLLVYEEDRLSHHGTTYLLTLATTAEQVLAPLGSSLGAWRPRE